MGPVGEVLTSPICAQRASGYNSRVLTFPNPELKNAKAAFIFDAPNADVHTGKECPSAPLCD